MLCGDVKRTVYFFLDESLGDNRRHDFEIHLTLCPDCEIRVVIQRRLRGFLRRRLSPLMAPDALRVRLSQSLRMPAE